MNLKKKRRIKYKGDSVNDKCLFTTTIIYIKRDVTCMDRRKTKKDYLKNRIDKIHDTFFPFA